MNKTDTGFVTKVLRPLKRLQLESAIKRNRPRKDIVELMSRNHLIAMELLTERLQDKNQDSRYRLCLISLLSDFDGPTASQQCLRLANDPNDNGPIRRAAVETIARLGCADNTPFWEALVSCAHETTGCVEHAAAKALCRTDRRDSIPHVGAYLIRCPANLRKEIEDALTAYDKNWASADEGRNLVPALLSAFKASTRLEDRQFFISLMGRIADSSFADLLRDYLDDPQLGPHAENALRAVGVKHNLEECLHLLETRGMRREQEQRDLEEQRRAAERRTEEEVASLRRRVHVGMSISEITEVLGKPSSTLGGAELLARFGSVSGSAAAVSSVTQRVYYIWRRPEGEWKLVFVGERLVEIYSTPQPRRTG